MESIRSLEEKKLPETCYVFKHSTRCPVSVRAADRVKGETWNLPLYWVDVIERRELSNWVAESLGVKHESPQLVLVREGSVVNVWNHGDVADAETFE